MNKKRQEKIVEIILDEKKVTVARLSELLDVSNVTIRKDLTSLSEQGIIKRTHNYAEIMDYDNISGKLAYHFKEKSAIAAAAVDLVSDGETLMIESGSCCAIFAKELANQRENMTVITNSIFIADYIGYKPDFQIILPGGILQQRSQALVGPLIEETVNKYHVDKMFIGTDGYSPKWGFSNKDHLRAEAVRNMSNNADKVIILTESEKFLNLGTYPIGIDERIYGVVTDDKIEKEQIKDLENKGIKVLKVKV